VPWSDVTTVRGKADRFDGVLVIERTDGTTVPLPVGLPRERADSWLASRST
jgi:hypothetical protein